MKLLFTAGQEGKGVMRAPYNGLRLSGNPRSAYGGVHRVARREWPLQARVRPIQRRNWMTADPSSVSI
jgi:hypothetical protein